MRKRWRSKSVREERAEDDISRCGVGFGFGASHFDWMLNMTIYIFVINMMFALLYDNNLDYGNAETDHNIMESRISLPPLSHGYQPR